MRPSQMPRIEINPAVALTLARGASIPVILILLTRHNATSAAWAAAVFVAGALTDFLDGLAARKLRCVTPFGSFIDPLCDKIFIYSVAFTLSARESLSFAIVTANFARDLAVDALRTRSAIAGEVLPANRWGKVKFTLQVSALGLGFAAVLFPSESTSLVRTANVTLAAALVASVPGLLLLIKAVRKRKEAAIPSVYSPG